MSDIPTNPFQFKLRTNTLNVNQQEMPDFNSKVSLIADRYDEHFETFKDLFKFLIDFAVFETDFSENKEGITLNDGEVIVTEESLAATSADLDDKGQQIEALKNQIKSLQDAADQKFAESVRASEEMENILLVPVTSDQKELLTLIAQNRLDKDYETDVPGSPDTPDSIIRKIAFRESYLYNEYKRFYTGI